MIAPGSTIVGRYRVETTLAEGSFGVVYAAHDVEEGDRVALKLLRGDQTGDEEILQRFAREAEIGAQLVHPRVARLRSLERTSLTDTGVPFLVFDCVPGLPLGVLLRQRGALSVEEAGHLMAHVLDALEAAHARGILHRDLKPDNVLIVPPDDARRPVDIAGTLAARLGVPEPDAETWRDLTTCEARVVDFGLGKLLEIEDREVAPLTRAGVAAGTAHYISPEQVRSETIDYRADLYGAGTLLYALLAGRPPFDDPLATTVALRHLREPFPPLPAPLDNHPIAAVVTRATEKKPGARYASAGEMRWALVMAAFPERATEERPTIVAPPRVRRPSAFNRLRRWWKD